MGVYYSTVYRTENDEVIVKIVNRNETEVKIELELDEAWANKEAYTADVMCHTEKDAYNCVAEPEKVKPYSVEGKIADGITLPGQSFVVVRV